MFRLIFTKSKQLGYIKSFASVSLEANDLDVVIIGGGVMGASLAYHLAEKGIGKIALFEKDSLTSGCTWHAAGLTTYFNPYPTMKNIHYNSIQLYSKIEQMPDLSCGFHQSGTIRLIASEDRLAEAKYQMSRSGWHPTPQHLISPDQIKELHPLLDTDQLLAGIYTENDGYVDPSQLTQALVTLAKTKGVTTVYEHTAVNAVKQIQDGKWDVDTNHGHLTATHLVNAAGLWARDLGRMLSVDLPVVMVEHQYVVTNPIEDVRQCERHLPVLRDLEGSCYIRQEMNGILFGPYESSSDMVLKDDWYNDGTPHDFSMTLFDSSPERISSHVAHAMELLPCTRDAQLHRIINGPMPYTPDGHGLAGPMPGFKNLWMLCGFTYGIIHAGGSGKYLADWMVHGEPSGHIFEIDPARYGSWADRSFTLPKIRETYGHNNLISYPREEFPAGRPTSRVSALHSLLESRGWESPLWFASPDDSFVEPSFDRPREWCQAVRRECNTAHSGSVVLDTSAFGKLLVTGGQSGQFLEYACVDFVHERALDQRGQICHLLTHSGQLYGQLRIIPLAKNRFLCITEPSAELHHLRWLQQLCDSFQCQVEAATEAFPSLALIGGKARDLLPCQLDEMQSSSIRIAGVDVVAFRHLFVGDGFDLVALSGRANDLTRMYRFFKERDPELTDIGHYAYDTLAIEQGTKRWPSEICVDYTPKETFMDFEAVLTKKQSANFVGQAAASSEPKSVRRLVRLHTSPANLEGSETIWCKDRPVGFVTSAGAVDLDGRLSAFTCLDELGESDESSLEVDSCGVRQSVVLG